MLSIPPAAPGTFVNVESTTRGKGKGETPEVQDLTAQSSCRSELRWEEVFPVLPDHS